MSNNIEFGCPGTITSKCATWNLQGPASLSTMKNLPEPESLGRFNQRFKAVWKGLDIPVKNLAYQLKDDDGAVIASGKTDKEGLTVVS